MSQRNNYSNYDNYLAIRMRQLNCCCVKGDRGDVGPIGPKGIPGTGIKGNQGIQGPVGPQGIPGAAGSRGNDGLKGDSGISVNAATWFLGSTGATGGYFTLGPTGTDNFGYQRLNINTTDQYKNDVAKWLSLIDDGDIIKIQDPTSLGQYHIYQVSNNDKLSPQMNIGITSLAGFTGPFGVGSDYVIGFDMIGPTGESGGGRGPGDDTGFVKDTSFNEIFYKKPDFVIGATGSYDTGDQRIELTWQTPPQKRAAFNFISAPANARTPAGQVFTPSLPQPQHDPNFPLAKGDKAVNLIVPAQSTGFYSNKGDEPGFSDLNYVPYHQDLRVDYRTRNGPGQTPSAWKGITATDLNYTRSNGEQMLWHQTRGLYIRDNAVPGTGNKGDYHPNIQPPSSEFIYEMQGNNKFSSNLSGLGYQFRVYLTNTSDEVLTPTTADTNFNSNNPPYWRYSYIPDNSNNYITFGSPGDATPPRNISNGSAGQPAGGPTFTNDPVQTYKTLTIIGANNNALPFLGTSGTDISGTPAAISSDATSPADISLNIPFNQLGTYSLNVNYGFDISASYVRDSLTPWGEQYNRPTPTLFSGILTSNSIQKNSWTTASDFTQNVSTLNNPANISNTIIYPGFSYTLDDYFMQLNTTPATKSYTNMFTNGNGQGGTGDSAGNVAVAFSRMVIKPPSRTDVSTDYTSYLTNQALFIEGGFAKQSGTKLQKQTGIYTATSSSIFSNVVYFFTSGTSASNYNIDLNGTRKCVNNKTNSTAGWNNGTGETIIGNDLSTFGVNGGLSRFILSSVDKSQTISTAYAGAWNSAPVSSSNAFLELQVSASIDAVQSPLPTIENDRLHGWYMGIDVTQAIAKGIKLLNYPDIAIRNSQPIGGTSYSPYVFTLNQQIDTNTSGPASNTPVGQTSQYDLYIAEIEPPITWAPTQHQGVTITMTPEFFGLNRPTNSNIATSGFEVSGNLNDISQRWRPELTLMNGEIKYYTSSSNTIQLQNANKTFTAQWSNITAPSATRRTETINETLQVAKSDLQQSSMNYSRDSAFIPQFAATGNYRNNVANSPQLQPYSYEFYFKPNVPNGTLLWWDYTMSSLSTPFNLTLSNPGSGGSGSPAPPSGGGAWMPTNSTGGTGFFSTYDHTNSLPNNQLMWANGGFRGAGTSGSNDPYIDFTTYHNQPTTGNYSTKKSLGENDTITYTPFGQYYLDNPFNPTPIKSITGTYKWINLKVVKSSATPNFLNVTVQNGASTLTLGTDYMLLVCEKATFGATESPYSNRSGWKDAARAFDSSLSGTARNANGTGINTFQYSSSSSSPPANGGELNIFKNNLQGLEIYLRIGLSNSSANTITNVSVSFT